MMSLWDALRMNMMISYQELVRTFPNFKKLAIQIQKIIIINIWTLIYRLFGQYLNGIIRRV
ncbi:Uncharacterised protein [Enterobacter hormaechei]|nr:Uncharacterised protein [Enterobacter hormaechei]